MRFLLQLQLLLYLSNNGVQRSGSTSGKTVTNHKRNTLSIEIKLQILKKIEKGSSLSSLAAEYGTGKSTIVYIKWFQVMVSELQTFQRFKHLTFPRGS